MTSLPAPSRAVAGPITISPVTTSPITISALRRRHLRGVAAVELEASSHPWSESLFEGELTLGDSRSYVVALSRSTVVGFGGVMFTGYEAHVTNVAVAPSHRGRGIATAMMSCLMDICRSRDVDDVTLEVRMSNEAGRALYHRFGFSPGGIRPGYYTAPAEDALIMWATDISADEMSRRLAAIPTPAGVRRDLSLAASAVGPNAHSMSRASRVHGGGRS